MSKEKQRKEHQASLGQKRLKEAILRYSNSSTTTGTRPEAPSAVSFQSYQKESLLRDALSSNYECVIDKKANSILLPLFGKAVPFHLRCIKNLTKNEEGNYTYLRINFNPPAAMPESCPYMKAISVRFSNSARAQEIFKNLQDMRKGLTEEAAKNNEDIVKQVALQESIGKKPLRLKDIVLRPATDSRRAIGDLEIHVNGIRWKSQLSTHVVEVIFSNVKHFIYQPCDKENIVVLHFNLHHPIVIGKKKTKDVQFYREVMESTVDETSGKRVRMVFGDEDEIAQEEEERKRRVRINEELKRFAEEIVTASRQTLELDIPFRKLGFPGVFARQSVLCQPTSDCLIQIVDYPFFVVTLNEVEVAFLERVVFGLKNFDLVFIFKDHNLPPFSINAIPMAQLEAIKDLLDSMDIYFVESKVNFNWPNIIKTVNEDPSGFYGMGGWTYLQPEEADDDGDSENESSEYEPESDEEEEEEYSTESESEEEEEDDDDDDDDDEGYEDDESEDESAPDWDELEEKARLEDQRRHDKSSSRSKPRLK